MPQEEMGITNIKLIKLKNWEEFEDQIEKEHDLTENLRRDKTSHVSDPLYRGHSNKDWKLSTTLERYSQENNCVVQEYSGEEYFNILRRVEPAILSLTSEKYKIPNEYEEPVLPRTPPGYDFMVFLRHHSFPSPLLDWTRSPYVAAFFAFHETSKNESVAIYSYREFLGAAKVHTGNEPHIWSCGPYVRTHERHYRQQCEYTICITEGPYTYCCHENVKFGEEQDLLTKYIIPSKERNKVLKKLALMNINAFSLFGSEEGLMSMLAHREIKRKERKIIKIGKLRITKDKLEGIKNERERYLFLQLLNILNDINCFQKVILYSDEKKDNLVAQEAQNQMTMTLLFVLSSKIKEGWELVRKDFLNNPEISKEYNLQFSKYGKECFEFLKSYFGKDNVIDKIRNQVAFHYDTDLLKAEFSEIVNKEFNLYISNANGETFSTTSHITWETLFNSINSDHKRALETILQDTIQTAKYFGGFIRSCIEIIHEKYFDEDDFEMIDIPDPIDFGDINLNFYSKPPPKN
jgi:hypothetical protein